MAHDDGGGMHNLIDRIQILLQNKNKIYWSHKYVITSPTIQHPNVYMFIALYK